MWNPVTITALCAGIVAIIGAVGAVLAAQSSSRAAATAAAHATAYAAALAAPTARPSTALVFHGPSCPGHTTGLPGAECLAPPASTPGA